MKLTVRKSDLDDWYIIERAEHDNLAWIERPGPNLSALRTSARFSDNADVEGSAAEMRAIADAIERRALVSFKRCAVDATSDVVRFRSPRNSVVDGVVSRPEADALAEIIRQMLPDAP